MSHSQVKVKVKVKVSNNSPMTCEGESWGVNSAAKTDINTWPWLQRQVTWFPVKEKLEIFALLGTCQVPSQLALDLGCNANTKLPSCIFAPLNGARELLFTPSDLIFFHVWQAVRRADASATILGISRLVMEGLWLADYLPCDLQDWNLASAADHLGGRLLGLKR